MSLTVLAVNKTLAFFPLGPSSEGREMAREFPLVWDRILECASWMELHVGATAGLCLKRGEGVDFKSR